MLIVKFFPVFLISWVFFSELWILKNINFLKNTKRKIFFLLPLHSLYHMLVYKNLDFVLWNNYLDKRFFFIMNIHVRLFWNKVKIYVLLDEIKYLLYLVFYFLASCTLLSRVKAILCLNLKLLSYLQKFNTMFCLHFLALML